MSRKFKTADYEAILDLTITLREALPPDHLVRFIVDVVAQLDFSKFYARYAATGAPPYAPELLFSLLLYGYCAGLFSSRKIEIATYESLPVRFVAGGVLPASGTHATFPRRSFVESMDVFVLVCFFSHS